MSKLKPDLKLAEKFLDVNAFDANVFIQHLDEQIKLREMSIEKRLKRTTL